MVLPLFKVFSLIIRVFSRPLIAYTKRIHLQQNPDASPIMRQAFARLGNNYNKWETILNRKFMKISSPFTYKPLKDEIAVEKGI